MSATCSRASVPLKKVTKIRQAQLSSEYILIAPLYLQVVLVVVCTPHLEVIVWNCSSQLLHTLLL